MNALGSLFSVYSKSSLVVRIIIGIVLGALLASFLPSAANKVVFLGQLFVNSLKAIAPFLVFILVVSSLCKQHINTSANLRPIILLYLIGTLVAAFTAVVFSFTFPSELLLDHQASDVSPPQGIVEVLSNLMLKVTQNPFSALMEGNYLGILTWAIGFGLFLKTAAASTKTTVGDFADATTSIVKFIIQLAPIGIFGLVAGTIAKTGFASLSIYAHLIGVLVMCMLCMAFIVNPIIVAIKTRTNPYPLVFKCLSNSAITAFFTRSSAANIPVNMQLCEELELNEDTYSVSIPLGATINMEGAAITVTIMTMAAVNTLGIQVDIATALLLSVIASLAACGASGVAGGSLLLIPLACSLFGISNDVAMQVVAIGFIIGVIQDSLETALNSSTDVLFTAAVCQHLDDS